MGRFRRLIANIRGRDLAVGDIHGHFQRLQQCLDAVGFDPAVDRLFSVGDLVDRGPHSEAALEWLAQPWFHAVQGNHEALAITRVRGGRLDLDMYRAAGGSWFLDLPRGEQLRFVERFEQLPIAIEVESAAGLVGLLHADSPFADWAVLRTWLELEDDPKVREVCQWSRRRLKEGDTQPVQGLRALLVGHTPVLEAKQLGNVWHLDTGGWASGHFTLMDMRTLKLISPAPGAATTPPPKPPA
ncbi:TPA: metallophosphoesterase [Pseudomonas putida]|jgi:serine/threonine protein phosphatase 1|uniref:Metallophosphoesterase n=1 Tax=Pseudomonas putida (strain GB-1) TaxID=76869 RepID=B0KU32_PSEPG|nr:MULTISPECIES: metallophosphoesterase [Pseudomonas]ABY98695.1 metallophosphoesterase [Pseudomonas putida GB-1]APE99017.1 serine/threonine protein phosphatase [Pseudomonas putida]MBP0709570.1 metallophosphoesterase [Pseudomonas sp. T34]MCE1001518.1 metallophosphoesterase [Pseudomonas sp. NMI1173_11]MCK2189013.1 metallophosphoesterase [Pseudomonas sp. MB04B]